MERRIKEKELQMQLKLKEIEAKPVERSPVTERRICPLMLVVRFV